MIQLSSHLRPAISAAVRILLVAALFLPVLASPAAAAPPEGSTLVPTPPAEELTGRVLVRLKPSVSAGRVPEVASARVVAGVEALNVSVLQPSAEGAGSLVARLRRNPNVCTARPSRRTIPTSTGSGVISRSALPGAGGSVPAALR